MAPGKVDLTAYRGDSFSQTLRFKTDAVTPEDLTGWSWVAQIREYADAAVPIAAFDVACPAPLTGEVTLSLTTAAAALLPRVALWDLQGTNGTTVLTRVYGQLTVTGDVTR